jgi:hypothetical protein
MLDRPQVYYKDTKVPFTFNRVLKDGNESYRCSKYKSFKCNARVLLWKNGELEMKVDYVAECKDFFTG